MEPFVVQTKCNNVTLKGCKSQDLNFTELYSGKYLNICIVTIRLYKNHKKA